MSLSFMSRTSQRTRGSLLAHFGPLLESSGQRRTHIGGKRPLGEMANVP